MNLELEVSFSLTSIGDIELPFTTNGPFLPSEEVVSAIRELTESSSKSEKEATVLL